MCKRLAMLLVVFCICGMTYSQPLYAQTIPQEEETVKQFFCSPCVFIPAIVRAVLRISQPIGVPDSYEETSRFLGQIVDTVSHPDGHVRILFGTSANQVTQDTCNVVLAGDDPARYDGIANVKYTFADGSFTYLPNTENLPNLAPMAGWRLNVEDEPKLVDLEQNLRSTGYVYQANILHNLIIAKATIYVAQLNRGSTVAYSLDTSQEAASQYQLVCHNRSVQ